MLITIPIYIVVPLLIIGPPLLLFWFYRAFLETNQDKYARLSEDRDFDYREKRHREWLRRDFGE